MANGSKTAEKVAQESDAPAQVSRRDTRHLLHPSEVQRVYAEGGTVVHNGEIHAKAEDLPEEVSKGEAFSEDSPMHPKRIAERRERRRIRAIQDGTYAQPLATAPTAPTTGDEEAEDLPEESPAYT